MSEISKERRLRMLDVELYKRDGVNLKKFKKYLLDIFQIEIDLRTLQRDMDELKHRLADRYDDDDTEFIFKEKGVYKYRENYYAFDETAYIDPTDLGQLLKYNPNFITEMEVKLEKKIAQIINEYSDSEDSKINWHPVVYQNKMNEGHKIFTKVLKYITEQIPVEIIHQSLGKEASNPKKYLFILLKALDNNFAKGWYVLAQRLNDGVREIELDVNNLNLIALDRIIKIRPLSNNVKTIYKKDFNPNSYFEHSVKGIMRNNLNKKRKEQERLSKEELHKNRVYREPEKVSLVILDKKNWICNYFERYPIHPSQFHRTDDKAFYIDLFVEVDMDLENLIYMYSKEIKVVEPLYLKNIIKERLQNALDNYE